MLQEYTTNEIKQFQNALNKLEKCSGNCKECKQCHIYFTESKDKHFIYYCYGCDLLPEKYFSCISDNMHALKETAIETLKFEIN